MAHYVMIPCWVCNGAIPRSYAPEDRCEKCDSEFVVWVDMEEVADKLMAKQLTSLITKDGKPLFRNEGKV